jgi:hypothetical protein
MEFASNCPISWPIKIPGITPDIDFGGVMFSFKHGLIFAPTEAPALMRPPVR